MSLMSSKLTEINVEVNNDYLKFHIFPGVESKHDKVQTIFFCNLNLQVINKQIIIASFHSVFMTE